jgi:hypothetical protein
MVQQQQRQGFNPRLLLILPAAFMLLGLWAALTPGWGMGHQVPVRAEDHAKAKHGLEAAKIRKCMDHPGPHDVWKMTSSHYPNHFIRTCRLEDGRWGLQIIQWTKDRIWREKTSFVVKDGTREQLTEYLTARAQEFTGSLGDIMLGG